MAGMAPRPVRAVTLPGGVAVPIPRWAVHLFGVVAVLGAGVGVYRYYSPAMPELVTVKQANAQLRLEVDHYNMHIVDMPTTSLADASGAVSVRMFEDGCLLVSRRRGQWSVTRLLIDPSSATTATTRRGVDRSTQGGVTLALIPPVAAQSRAPVCLNPHPGEFTWRYGEKDRNDSCWIEVWRRWPDACEHVQLYSVCSNTWQTNKDGSPAVRWTHCVH